MQSLAISSHSNLDAADNPSPPPQIQISTIQSPKIQISIVQPLVTSHSNLNGVAAHHHRNIHCSMVQSSTCHHPNIHCSMVQSFTCHHLKFKSRWCNQPLATTSNAVLNGAVTRHHLKFKYRWCSLPHSSPSKIQISIMQTLLVTSSHSNLVGILAKYNMVGAYGKQTPCTTSIDSQRLLEPVTPYTPMFGNNYRNIVGSLGYVRHTRPDLCVPLGITAQFSKQGRHGPQHYRAPRSIIRFSKRTMHHGLLYTSTCKSSHDPWIVSTHVDSDWGSCKATRRSRTDYLIFLCNCLIAFGSKLQPAVALSSGEAEYMALSHVTRILLWIINIIEAIPGQFIKHPILVYEDEPTTTRRG